jgi:hypothetical protein
MACGVVMLAVATTELKKCMVGNWREWIDKWCQILMLLA